MNRRLPTVVALVVVVAVVGAFGAAGQFPGPASPDQGETHTTDRTVTRTTTVDADDGTLVEFVTGDDGGLTLEPAADQVVRGETGLSAGTTIVVRLRSTNGSNPFLHSAETTVAEDGRFEATFDLSRVGGGTEFTAVVRSDDERIANATGVVVSDA